MPQEERVQWDVWPNTRAPPQPSVLQNNFSKKYVRESPACQVLPLQSHFCAGERGRPAAGEHSPLSEAEVRPRTGNVFEHILTFKYTLKYHFSQEEAKGTGMCFIKCGSSFLPRLSRPDKGRVWTFSQCFATPIPNAFSGNWVQQWRKVKSWNTSLVYLQTSQLL